MRLYHGSKCGIEGPIRLISRACRDFGRGFHMGSEPSRPMTLICREKSPESYTCEFGSCGLRVEANELAVEDLRALAAKKKARSA